MANPVRQYEHETSTSLIELNAVETKGVATAQPLAPYAFVCHTAAWPLSPRQFQQLTSRVGKHSTAAAWPLSPRQFQQLTSRAGTVAWPLSPRQFQQLTSRIGKRSTAAAWPLSSADSAASLSRWEALNCSSRASLSSVTCVARLALSLSRRCLNLRSFCSAVSLARRVRAPRVRVWRDY